MAPAIRTNLLLLLVVAVLVCAVWWRPQAAMTTAHPLTRLAVAEIRSITLQQAGDSAVIQLRRSGNTWQLQEPVVGRADLGRVNRILAIAQEQTSRQLPAIDIERYGLTKPLVVLQFDQTRLAFGNLNAITGEQYALTPQGVMLIQNQTIAPLLVAVDDLRDHRLLAETEQPVAVTLQGRRAQQQAGRWQVPGAEAASQDNWNRWQELWRLSTARRVTRDTLTNVTEHVELACANGQRIRLQLSVAGEQIRVYREDEGLVYEFTRQAMQPLLRFPVDKAV